MDSFHTCMCGCAITAATPFFRSPHQMLDWLPVCFMFSLCLSAEAQLYHLWLNMVWSHQARKPDMSLSRGLNYSETRLTGYRLNARLAIPLPSIHPCLLNYSLFPILCINSGACHFEMRWIALLHVSHSSLSKVDANRCDLSSSLLLRRERVFSLRMRNFTKQSPRLRCQQTD